LSANEKNLSNKKQWKEKDDFGFGS